MNKYLFELYNEKKALNARRDNLLRAVIITGKKKGSSESRDRNFKKIVEIKEKIEKIDKKIKFVFNLDEEIDKIEKIDESDSNIQRNKKDSLGTR